MKNYLVLIVILLLVEWEVNANAHANLVNDAPEIDMNDDRLKEKGVKWDIDLDDMLHFNKYGSYSEYAYRKQPTQNKDSEKKGRLIDGNNGDKGYEQSVGEYEGHHKKKKTAEVTKGNSGNKQAVGKVKRHGENEKSTGVKVPKESETFKRQIQDYILRYVNLFLRSLNLQDKKMTERSNEEFSVYLELVISSKDLATLQNLSKNLNQRNILDQLYIIDSILSKGLYLREKYTFYDDVLAFIESWSTSKNSYLLIFATVALFMVAVKNIAGFSYKFIILVLLNNMILLEGIFSYWIKLKEAAIVDHVGKMQLSEMPHRCTVPRKSLFGKIQDWLFGDDCLTYHKLMQLSRGDTIFPLESILRAYSYYLLEMPFELVGSAVKGFSVKLHDHLPPVIREIGQFSTNYSIIAFLCFFVLLFCGLIIRFNFWGARIEFGLRQWIRSRRRYPEDEGPPEYHRIRDLPRSEIREMEKEYVQQPPDYLEEGSGSVSEVVKDTGNVDHRRVEESRVEENNGVDILDEDVRSDNETFVSEERNLSQDIKTVKKLLAELKPSE